MSHRVWIIAIVSVVMIIACLYGLYVVFLSPKTETPVPGEKIREYRIEITDMKINGSLFPTRGLIKITEFPTLRQSVVYLNIPDLGLWTVMDSHEDLGHMTDPSPQADLLLYR